LLISLFDQILIIFATENYKTEGINMKQLSLAMVRVWEKLKEQ